MRIERHHAGVDGSFVCRFGSGHALSARIRVFIPLLGSLLAFGRSILVLLRR